jgi:hypothetical protein
MTLVTTSGDEARIDETWHRLLDWTYGQAPSERLAALILDEEGYKDIDPSHPLGGKDGGRDGECLRDGNKWTWAVHFPRGQQDLNTTKTKLQDDIAVARKHDPAGIAFVTNQELRLAERRDLRLLGGDIEIELFHLERVATILDRPRMASIRQQYLKIGAGRPPMIVKASVAGTAVAFTDEDAVLNVLVDTYENQIRERSEKAKQLGSGHPLSLVDFNVAGHYQSLGLRESPAPKVLSESEIEDDVQAFREVLETDWDWSRDYLAGAAWSGVKFTIENVETSFLNNVEIVLTFTGARGIDWAATDTFDLEKMQDRHWTPPGWEMTSYVPSRLKDYPVTYDHNDDGDLEVTITLTTLRPRKTWVSGDDDVVLMTRSDDIDDVTVTYTVTADGYNELFEGGPITIPVQRVSAFNTLADILGVEAPE